MPKPSWLMPNANPVPVEDLADLEPQATQPAPAGRSGFLVHADLTYGPSSKTCSPGDEVYDLPPESIGWLLDDGLISRLPAPSTEDQD